MTGKWRLNDDGTATFVTDHHGDITIDQRNFFDSVGEDIIDIQKEHDDYHEYGYLNDLGISVDDVNIEVVQAALATYATPLGPKKLNYAGPGFVKQSSANPNVVTNHTTNLHLLDPGVVQRSIVVKNGNYHIRTVGIGTGILKEMNLEHAEDVWGNADKKIKKWVENYKDTNSFQLVPVHKKIIGDRQDRQSLNDRLQSFPSSNIENSDSFEKGKRKNMKGNIWGEPEEIFPSDTDIQNRILEDAQQKGQLLNRNDVAAEDLNGDIEKKANPRSFLNDYAHNALLHPQVR